jgi:hypothetical protein
MQNAPPLPAGRQEDLQARFIGYVSILGLRKQTVKIELKSMRDATLDRR